MNVIKPIFKTFFLSLCVIANVHFAYAQQGGIIPNALNVFLDNNGKPLSSGKVYFYIPSTTTPKTTYSDINLTFPNTNPVILDAAGRPNGSKGLWGTGNYRQIVQDKNSNVIWDQTTSAAGSGSGGGGTATGDGDLVGTIKPWAGMIAPNQYMFTYGAEVSRATFTALYNAITFTQPTFCTSSSPILTGLSNTTNFWVGMTVETPCVISGVATIVSKTSTTITLSSNANINANTSSIFYPWGNGNGSTTFNIPDFRGLIPVGNNIMGGVASSNISDTYFGTALAESSGGQGGSSNGGSIALAAANLAAHTHASSTLTDPQHTHNLPNGLNTTSGGGAQLGTASGANYTSNGQTVSSSSTGITISANTGTNSTGISTPFSILPPLKTVNYIIKVTPDQNSATASGVTSLGLMTGDIACGAGLTCTGNTISTTGGGGGSGTVTAVAINAGANITLTGTCNSTTTINCTVSTSATTNTCPIGYFCVSNFANTAAAVTALNSAGGGTLYFDKSVTLSSAQAISDNTTIKCADSGVKIGTSSTTASLFTFANTSNNTIDNCYFIYTGTPGTKTAGYLLDINAFQNTKLHNLFFDAYCFVCVHINSSSDVELTNITFLGNVSAAPAAGLTGLILCDGGEAHLSNIHSGASATGDFYFFGITNNGCSLELSNFELITQKIAYLSAPATGQAAFGFISNGFVDNPSIYGFLLQPATGGVIGYTSLNNMEIGLNGGNAAIQVDNTNGSTGTTTVTGITAFNYTDAAGFGVNIVGGANPIQFNMSASQFGATGTRFVDAFNINSGVTGGFSVIGNSFKGSVNSISLASILTQAQIMFNRLNGGSIITGGNSATNVANNLP